MTDAAAEFRSERDSARRRRGAWAFLPPGGEDPPPPGGMQEYGEGLATQRLPVIEAVCAASLAQKPIPERSWLVHNLIPDRSVTILSGDGGVGKSLLALQLAVATVTATDWAGAMPQPGPALYLSAEDDLDEIHRRLASIAAGCFDLATFDDLHIVPLAGLDAVLGAPDRRGIVEPTNLWRAIVDKIAVLRPRLLVVDNLADAFAGNENSRPEARQFVGMLRGAAIEYDLAVVLIAHPSLTGLSTGTGTSGSTAWSNSVRSRLYLDRATDGDGSEPDPSLRVLRLKKANYAPTGSEIRLKWQDGRFRLDGLGAGGFDRLAKDQRAERVFVELTKRFAEQGRDVSHNPSATYAPSVFSREPEGADISPQIFAAAMSRLFKSETIRVEKFGPPSKQRSRIVVSN